MMPQTIALQNCVVISVVQHGTDAQKAKRMAYGFGPIVGRLQRVCTWLLICQFAETYSDEEIKAHQPFRLAEGLGRTV